MSAQPTHHHAGTMHNIRVLLSLLSPALVLARVTTRVEDKSWGDEYCRASLCGVMPRTRWQECCDDFHQCCAYVEFIRPKGPFHYEEPAGNPIHGTSYPVPAPQETPARSEEVSEDVESISVVVHRLPEAARQTMKENLISSQGSQPRPQPPQSDSLIKPAAPAPPQWLPSSTKKPNRTYNEVLRRDDEKKCRPKFCSLLNEDKQSRCCHLYKQCCAYVNLHRGNDPFYFEKETGSYY